jgi:hypothetical protein
MARSAAPPGRPLADVDLRETGAGETTAQVDRAQAIGQPGIGRVHRLPAGEHRPTARDQDPAHLLVGGRRLLGELDGVDAQHAGDRVRVEPGGRQVAGAEVGRAPEPLGLLRGLTHRLRREVDADQVGAGAARDLQAVAAAAAGEVQQGVAGRQPQLVDDLGDAVPAQQAGGQHVRRQAEVALLDLVLDRRGHHVGVPVVEVRR